MAEGLDDALAFVDAHGLLDKPKAGVYGVKAELHKSLLAELAGAGLDAEERRFADDQQREAERREFGRVWYEQWLRERDGPKL